MNPKQTIFLWGNITTAQPGLQFSQTGLLVTA